MYDVVHAMRTRLITSPAFSGKRLIGAILFENTMDRDIEGKPTPTYLWEAKGVVPFLKVDKGLADEKDGVQLMKPMPDLDALLKRAKAKNVFGTKMRSVIKQANAGRHRRRREAAVRRRQGDRRGGPRADHRARGRHQDAEQGQGRRPAESRDPEAAERAEARPARDAEAHDSRQGQPLRRPHQAQERAARRGAVRRLFARRRQQAPCPQQRHDGELLARARRGPEGSAIGQGVQRRARCLDREHLSRARSPELKLALA